MEKQIKSKKRVADHGEVFTAEREVNAMLDLVKQETERIDSRFLEPACGDGNFLVEILRRKLAVVRRKYQKSPFDYERNAVLAITSIYGVDLMLDNVLACRERLFGIWDKEYKAVCKKETNDQTRAAVRFILSRNIVCGNALTMMCVDDKQQDTDEFIVFPEWSFPFNDARIQCRDFRFDVLLKENEDEDNYDTQFNLFGDDATMTPERVFDMKFDVIIGNPPYQLSVNESGKGLGAVPLYHKFIEQAIKMNPRYISMIVPSRWFAGGVGLENFRKRMLADKRLSHIVDYIDSNDCFPGVDINGGICYFLWDNQHDGLCHYTNIHNGKESTALRDLNEHSIFIRRNEAVSIIHKVLSHKERKLSDPGGCSPQTPYGFLSTFVGTETKTKPNDCAILSSKGWMYVERSKVQKYTESIDMYKPMLSKLSCEHAGNPDKNGMYRVLSRMELLSPEQICTQSYLVACPTYSKIEAQNTYNYLRTKFVRFLILQTLVGMNISISNFVFVPWLDFSKSWTDEELYKRYQLTAEEISSIESMIKPMETAFAQGFLTLK